MKNQQPCAEWAEMLAISYPEKDLSPSEYRAFQEHLAGCPGCVAVREQYQLMALRVRTLPVVKPVPHFTPQLVDLVEGDMLEQEEAEYALSKSGSYKSDSIESGRPRGATSWVGVVGTLIVVSALVSAFLVLSQPHGLQAIATFFRMAYHLVLAIPTSLIAVFLLGGGSFVVALSVVSMLGKKGNYHLRPLLSAGAALLLLIGFLGVLAGMIDHSSYGKSPFQLPLQPPAPLITPSSLPGVEAQYHRAIFSVDANGLLMNSPSAINSFEQQVRAQSFLRNRQVALVIAYGGAPDSTQMQRASALASKAYSVLQLLGRQGFAFSHASYYDSLYELGGDSDTVILDVFLFAQGSASASRFELQPHEVTLSVDSNGLLNGSQSAIDGVKQQIQEQAFLMNRQVGLVIVYGGAPDDSHIAAAEQTSVKVMDVLKGLGQQGGAFAHASYYDPLYIFGISANTIRVGVYLDAPSVPPWPTTAEQAATLFGGSPSEWQLIDHGNGWHYVAASGDETIDARGYQGEGYRNGSQKGAVCFAFSDKVSTQGAVIWRSQATPSGLQGLAAYISSKNGVTCTTA